MTTKSRSRPYSEPWEDTTEGCALKLVSLALTLLGALRRDEGRFDEALRDLTWAIRHWPENSDAHYHRAIVHAYLGQKQQYTADWKRAEHLTPGYASTPFTPTALHHVYVLDYGLQCGRTQGETFPATPAGLASVLRRAAEICEATDGLPGGFRVVERLCLDRELVRDLDPIS